jgi:uncharacterized protein DUF6496
MQLVMEVPPVHDTLRNSMSNALRTTTVPRSEREPLPLIGRFRRGATLLFDGIYFLGDSYGQEAETEIFARRRHRSEGEMHRYKRGKAKSGKGGKGDKVKGRKQAIAIGLSKARKKGKKVPKKK